MASVDAEGMSLIDKPRPGVGFGDTVATPDGLFGRVTEFDEEGMVQVTYLAKCAPMFGPKSNWFNEDELVVQSDEV